MAKRWWLVKSEPDVYSLDDLERDGSTSWDGVRNYQARNNLRAMNAGDEVLFYHSNAGPPGVVGIARVSREAYADPSQFDRKSDYHDAKSDPADPRWSLVDLAFVARLPKMVPLDDIKAHRALAGMELVRYGRLSVQAVTRPEFERVKKMGGLK
jgi:predicted RNA-binding protein with PUA-like domain